MRIRAVLIRYETMLRIVIQRGGRLLFDKWLIREGREEKQKLAYVLYELPRLNFSIIDIYLVEPLEPLTQSTVDPANASNRDLLSCGADPLVFGH